MGSGKKKKQPAPPHPDDDDALLAAAIAENAAVREAEAKMQPQRPTIVLTLQQSLAKLDRVHTFHVVTVLANDSLIVAISARISPDVVSNDLNCCVAPSNSWANAR